MQHCRSFLICTGAFCLREGQEVLSLLILSFNVLQAIFAYKAVLESQVTLLSAQRARHFRCTHDLRIENRLFQLFHLVPRFPVSDAFSASFETMLHKVSDYHTKTFKKKVNLNITKCNK